jgi:cardiolipin synthase
MLGCGVAGLVPAAPETNSSAAVSLQGTVHGGQQPVSGAVIQLYAVGTTGFQSASTAKISSTVKTDTNGNFTINSDYTCGTATQVYLTATGGSALSSGSNANLVMMTALGPCSGLGSGTYITINEVTTVAAVAALAPYMASVTAVGSSSSGTYTGDEALSLAQAFTLAGEYAVAATGASPGSGYPVTQKVPSALINTLANIMAACVNTTGGVAGDGTTKCGTLFGAAKSSAGVAPTDTLTAMLNILNHPTANVATLYGLDAGMSPFQPDLSTQPSTFAVALQPATAATITRTLYVEPDNGLTFLYNLANNAASTIDLTMYGLADTTLTGDFVTACKRGVIVRVILDQNNEKSINTAAYNQLNAQAGCSAAWANPAFQVTHQKTMTVDRTTSAILTLNLETSDYAGTRDFALVTNDAIDVAAIEATFNQDYNSTTDYAYVPNLGTDLVWSPTNARAALTAIINNATSTLNVENEEMSDPTIVAALEAACQRGVTTHITMTNQTEYHSEFSALEAAGCGVHVYADSTKYIYIHAKVTLADNSLAGQIVYMGSINFSTASLVENRELGTILTDSTVISGLNTTLNTDYNGATAY